MNRDKIESKNKLDSLVYQTRSTIENDQIKGKLEESDLKTVTDTLTETELWLEEERTKDEYDNKMTEVNSVLNPIMMKVYSEGGAGDSMPSAVSESFSGGVDTKPTIDEID